jgi:hypothetical protein
MLQKQENRAQHAKTVVDVWLMSQSNPEVVSKSLRPVMCGKAGSTKAAVQKKLFVVQVERGGSKTLTCPIFVAYAPGDGRDTEVTVMGAASPIAICEVANHAKVLRVRKVPAWCHARPHSMLQSRYWEAFFSYCMLHFSMPVIGVGVG